jgi:hypothetical protein
MNRASLPVGARLLRRLRLATTILAAPAVLGACGDLFNVDNPVDILETDLDDARSIPALSNSAEAAVVDAYDVAVQYAELVTDGAIHISTNQGNVALDRGVLGEFNERAEQMYNEMASARWVAEEATRRLTGLVANPTADASVARGHYWDALARITLADMIEEVPFNGGPPITPVATLEGAVALLQQSATISAAAAAAGTGAVATDARRYEAAAYATIARARRSLYFEKNRDMAEFQRAAVAAERALQLVPNFRLDARYALPGSSNGLSPAWDIAVNYDVMGPAFANRIDPVSGVRDNRVRHGPARATLSTFGDSVYQQQKYPERGSPIRVSSWQEARLILAEYNLLTNNLPQAVAHINAVRAAAGLPAFASGDAAAIRAQLLYERSTEFWIELRRWQDMRYYGIVPPRWDPAMRQAGVNRRFPVSLRERSSNPHYTGRIAG